jgi:hypothetical protein
MTETAGTDVAPQPDAAVVVDPRTGVAFQPGEVSDSLLVEIFGELQRREKQMQEWRRLAENELVRRQQDKGWTVVDGNRIDVDNGMSRVWDAEELELVATDLVARGHLSLFDISGLIRNERKVDGRKALDLLNRGDEETGIELRRCFQWKRGRARVKVTPIAEIEG